MASKVELNINLVDIFDRAYKSRSERSQLRPLLSSRRVKETFGRAYIREIRTRTQQRNIDKDSNQFTPYSESYKRSEDFKRLKGGRKRVNLTLRGDMLASLRTANKRGTRVTIDFDNKEDNDKAHGHINGTEVLPVRDFFGLPPKTEERLLKEIVNSASRDNALGIIDTLARGTQLRATIGRQELLLSEVIGGN